MQSGPRPLARLLPCNTTAVNVRYNIVFANYVHLIDTKNVLVPCRVDTKDEFTLSCNTTRLNVDDEWEKMKVWGLATR